MASSKLWAEGRNGLALWVKLFVEAYLFVALLFKNGGQKWQSNARFRNLNARFREINAKFSKINARFLRFNARFPKINARFLTSDARFMTFNAKLDFFGAGFLLKNAC